MKERKLSRALAIRVALALITIFGLASMLLFDPGFDLVTQVNSMDAQSLPNNRPHPNPGGAVFPVTSRKKPGASIPARYKSSSIKPAGLTRSSTCSTLTIPAWTSPRRRRDSLPTA